MLAVQLFHNKMFQSKSNVFVFFPVQENVKSLCPSQHFNSTAGILDFLYVLRLRSNHKFSRMGKVMQLLSKKS